MIEAGQTETRLTGRTDQTKPFQRIFIAIEEWHGGVPGDVEGENMAPLSVRLIPLGRVVLLSDLKPS